MLKVLHVSAAAERGGLEAILLNILKCLDRSRFVPEVLFLEDGPFVREVQETGTETHVIRAGRVREIVRGGRAIAGAVQLIRRQGIDIVHSHNAKAQIYGGVAATIARVPSIYHLHGVPRLTPSRDGVVSLLAVLTRAHRTVACSGYVANAFRHAWRSTRDVLVLRNGVLAAASPNRTGAPGIREEFGIPTSASLVVMVSRLQRWKGVHVFVDAAAQVAKHYPDAYFLIVGGTLFGLEEEYVTDLREQVKRLELEEVLQFTGFRSDVFRFFDAADLIVHCSIEPDPFPTVLLEAMAHAKVVVASDLGGPAEIVEEGVTGLLVLPRSTESLAHAILTILGDSERRIRMGQAGAARLRDHFTAEKMVQQLQSVYQGLAGVSFTN